jgi:hypothetical protein
MEEIVLKDWVLKRIKEDVFLTAKIADKLHITSLRYFGDVLKNNDPRLTQASVLRILKEHLNTSDERQFLTEPQTAAA